MITTVSTPQYAVSNLRRYTTGNILEFRFDDRRNYVDLYLRALNDFKKICPEHERGYETFQKMCSFALMAPISSYHIDYSLKNQTLYFRIKYRTGAVLTLSKPLDAESEDFLAYSFVYKDDEDQTARKVGLDETENVKRQVFSLLN